MTTTLDISGRADAFVGDSDRDGGSVYTPLCLSCKHKVDLYTCEAFKGGIPVGIVVGSLDHHKPIPGDGGIQYDAA